MRERVKIPFIKLDVKSYDFISVLKKFYETIGIYLENEETHYKEKDSENVIEFEYDDSGSIFILDNIVDIRLLNSFDYEKVNLDDKYYLMEYQKFNGFITTHIINSKTYSQLVKLLKPVPIGY